MESNWYDGALGFFSNYAETTATNLLDDFFGVNKKPSDNSQMQPQPQTNVVTIAQEVKPDNKKYIMWAVGGVAVLALIFLVTKK